jgi:hypothetical protein
VIVDSNRNNLNSISTGVQINGAKMQVPLSQVAFPRLQISVKLNYASCRTPAQTKKYQKTNPKATNDYAAIEENSIRILK